MNDIVEINYDYLEGKDIDRVVAIEEESNPVPWTVKNFKDCIEKGYYSLVLKENNKVIGFAIIPLLFKLSITS